VEAFRFARGWSSHIFKYSAHRWRQCCQPYAPAAFYAQEDSWYSYLWVEPRTIVRLEGLGKLKKRSTSSRTRTGDLPACSTVPQQATACPDDYYMDPCVRNKRSRRIIDALWHRKRPRTVYCKTMNTHFEVYIFFNFRFAWILTNCLFI
jgi:hypothetical protein